MEERCYIYKKVYKGEGGKPIKYEVSGEAYFPGVHSTLMRKLPLFPHTKNYGIDKVSVSLPRDYLDEDAFNNLMLRKAISRKLFISCKGAKVCISFQRELFDETKGYLEQIRTVLFSLYQNNGLFKFPLTKRTVYDDGRRKEEPFPSISTSEDQFEFLCNLMVLEEVEVFFDHDRSILSSLRYLPDEVKNFKGTIYSADYEKKHKGFSKKSFVKIYDKVEAQKAHSRKVSALEEKYPLRIELTLSKEKMSYMGINGLDYPAEVIISLLSDALSKEIHEGVPWLTSIKGNPLLNERLSVIIGITPKKRLRVSKELLERTRGDTRSCKVTANRKVHHSVSTRKGGPNDDVLDTWDDLLIRKNQEAKVEKEYSKVSKGRIIERKNVFEHLPKLSEGVLRKRIYIKESRGESRKPPGSTGPPYIMRIMLDSS